jgi:molybdenum cofactor biosynthesis enzyme MoaA
MNRPNEAGLTIEIDYVVLKDVVDAHIEVVLKMGQRLAFETPVDQLD